MLRRRASRHATAAMIDDMLLPFDLPAVQRKKLTIDFEGGKSASDGSLLLLREAERRLGVCRRLADAMPDRRDQSRIRHDMVELLTARAFARRTHGIIMGMVGRTPANDHGHGEGTGDCGPRGWLTPVK